jgi:hypothetical protein
MDSQRTQISQISQKTLESIAKSIVYQRLMPFSMDSLWAHFTDFKGSKNFKQ